MTTTADPVVAFVQETDAMGAKQAAERRYEEARAVFIRLESAVVDAKRELREARAERAAARRAYEESVRSHRKPRQRNVVRRVLLALEAEPLTRRQIIVGSGLDSTSVSTTLTRCKRAGFVVRDGDDFIGKWRLTPSGHNWARSNEPMPKV